MSTPKDESRTLLESNPEGSSHFSLVPSLEHLSIFRIHGEYLRCCGSAIKLLFVIRKKETTIGGNAAIVKTGEMLIMPANITHVLHAHERFKMLLIMIRGE